MKPKLFMTPALAKAGKLYSQIGNDFTVSRNLAASFRNAAGLLEFAAANVPRIEYPSDLTCPYLLREAIGQNELLQSNTFSTLPWIGDAILTSGQASPTIAGNQGWLANDNNPAAFLLINQVILKTQNANKYSIFIRKTIGTPTHYPAMGMVYSTASVSNNLAYYILNTTAGTGFLQAGATTASPSITIEDWGLFWRFVMQTTDSSATQTQLFVEFYPAASLDGQTGTPTATGTQVIYGAMIGDGSYIDTTTTAVTRPADIITATDQAGAATNTFVFDDGTTTTEAASGTIAIPVGKLTYVKQD